MPNKEYIQKVCICKIATLVSKQCIVTCEYMPHAYKHTNEKVSRKAQETYIRMGKGII